MQFLKKDILILRESMDCLKFYERQILILRYWENFTIEEIAISLEMEWGEVNRSIEDSHQKIKTFCLSFPDFSVNTQIEIAA